MSANHREGHQFNEQICIKDCKVCGTDVTRLSITDEAGCLFCSFKCAKEYHQLMNKLADEQEKDIGSDSQASAILDRGGK